MSVDTSILWEQVDAHFRECERIEAATAVQVIEEQVVDRRADAVEGLCEDLDLSIGGALRALTDAIERALPAEVPDAVYETILAAATTFGTTLGEAYSAFSKAAQEELSLPVDMLRENLSILFSYTAEGE